jgi:Mor family transcriptional regulator
MAMRSAVVDFAWEATVKLGTAADVIASEEQDQQLITFYTLLGSQLSSIKAVLDNLDKSPKDLRDTEWILKLLGLLERLAQVDRLKALPNENYTR